jgi:hypothetical protein
MLRMHITDAQIGATACSKLCCIIILSLTEDKAAMKIQFVCKLSITRQQLQMFSRIVSGFRRNPKPRTDSFLATDLASMKSRLAFWKAMGRPTWTCIFGNTPSAIVFYGECIHSPLHTEPTILTPICPLHHPPSHPNFGVLVRNLLFQWRTTKQNSQI